MRRTLFTIVAIALLFSAGLYVFLTPQKVTAPEVRRAPEAISVEISIEGFLASTSLSILSGTNLLDATRDVARTYAIDIHEETYDGLGTLITGFGTTTNGTGNRYWQYTVNGTMPMVGAGALTLSPGDSIRWYFAESEF